MSRWTLLLILTLRWATGVAQPQVSVTHFDEFSGMAQWYVTQIVQDRSGMIWMATWNGLNRYDGYQFECFKSHPGDGCDMPSDRISNMMLNDEGNLWCLVDDRVFVFDVGTCRFSSLSAADEARAMKAFGLGDDYTARYEPPYSVVTDPYGTQWRIRSDGSLDYKDGDAADFRPYDRVLGQATNVYFCTSDREGNAWLRSKYGAYKLTFTKHPYTRLPQETAEQVRCLYLDNRRRYWVTTRDDASIRLFDADNRPLGYLGRDGRLHAAYTSFGSPVYCMLQTRDGAFWLGSKPHGLFRLREGKDGAFSVEQFRYVPSDPASIRHDHIFHLAQDRQGRLWVASFRGGLHCIEHPEADEVVTLNKDNGLQCPADSFLLVRHIHITDDDVLLAATTSGLMVADLKPRNSRQINFHLHTKDAHRSTSLSNNATMYVAEDSRHRLYVCTESGGVNQIVSDDLLADVLEFRHYDMATGFPSDVALSAVPVDDHLLVVSNNQLVRLFPDEDGRSEPLFWRDQLRFSDATPLRLPDGRWLIGLQDGAFFVRPDDIRKNPFVPTIGLTGISVQNRPLDHAVNGLDTLVLSPPDRSVIIHFAALIYADADQVSYAFRMSDDHTWNEIGKNRSVTLLDLKPGSHELQIRSTNGDGEWVDNVRTLTIIVRPTFWETGWARLLYFLVFVAVVGAILYTRSYIRRIKQQQRETHEAYLKLLDAHNSVAEQQTIERQEQETLAKATPQDDAFMKRVMKFIEQHIGDPDISIGDLAEAAATSRSGLNRKMKSLMGVTPIDFIREARIQKACTMLAQGLAVNDVAYSCGFSDPKYFAKCFKADKGMTPTEFKAQNHGV